MNTLKKFLMMALVVQLASIMMPTQAHAQTKKADPTVTSSAELNKVEIKKEELPDTTKKILASVEFKDWTVTKVYKLKTNVKDASGKEIFEYEVEVAKADQKQILMFDKDGNIKSKEG